MTVIISVFNDAARLAPKLDALFRVRGAEKICEVLVGSDGSTDDIAATLANLQDSRVKLIEFSQRRGKASVLNDLTARSTGEIVVMMDARQMLTEDALEALLVPFADPAVGVVSGQLVFRRNAGGVSPGGVGSYWNYEKMIRRAEAKFSSVPGATGALYAIRRALLRPIPSATILDDVAIPMLAVEQGSRCIFEDAAICLDEVAASVGTEQIRKRRTLAGNIQIAMLFPRWLVPWKNPIWWQFISHKMLRLFTPFFLFGLLATSVALRHHPFFRAALAFELLACLLALAGWAADRAGFRTGLVSIPYVFAALNATILLAWFDALCGRFVAAWQKT